MFTTLIRFLILGLFLTPLPGQSEDPALTPRELEAQLSSATPAERWKILDLLVDRTMDSQPARSLEYSRRALALAETMHDNAKAAESGKDMGIACIYLGQYRRALAVTRKSLDRAHSENLGELIPICHNNMGVSHRFLAEYGQALDHYALALKGFRDLGQERIVAVTLSNIGVIHFFRGQRDKAMSLYSRALEIHRRLGNRTGEAEVLNQIAVLYDETENFPKALEFYQQSLAIYEEVGNPRGMVDPINNIGIIRYRRLKDFTQAERDFTRVLNLRRQMEDAYGESIALNNLGNVYLSQGKLQTALEHYTKSLALKEKMGNRRELTDTLRDLGEVHRRLGNLKSSLNYLHRALEIAVEIGAERETMNAHLDLAETHEQMGQWEKALSHYRRYHELAMKRRGIELSTITSEMQVRFESEQKEQEIRQLKSNQKNQKRIHDLLLLSLALMLLILLLVLNRSRLRRGAHLRQMQLTEKIQHQKERLEALNQVLERKNREYYRSAIMDSLTGIYNRAYLDDSLEREIRRARRRGHDLSLIMMDIDRFKQVNDKHGHLAGDELLRLMAQRIQSMVRGEDIFGRFGGDEFILILPGVSSVNAIALAEKIRRAVAGNPFPLPGEKLTITISLGTSTRGNKERISAQELLDRSDRALYRAKEGGRNRVENHDSPRRVKAAKG